MCRPARSLLLACAAAVAVWAAGCQSCSKTAGKAASREDMALVPRDSNFVLMGNFKKLRATPLWKRVMDVPDQTPEQKAKYADFVKQTGLDPLKQIDSIFVALPQASAAGEFTAVLRGGPFDEARLMEFMKAQFKSDGGDLVTSEYGGHKRYSDNKGVTFAVFIDKTTLVFASDTWSKKVIDLAGQSARPAPGQSAELAADKNEPLAALVKRTNVGDAIWGAGIVAPEARARLAQNPELKAAGSLKDVNLSADFAGGFKLAMIADLGSDADATELSNTLKDQVAQSRQNTQVQMMGLTRYFDGVKVASQGPALHIDVKLDQAGVDDLLDRLAGLMKSVGGAIGGTPPGPQ